jgi:hypothetical protein
MIPVRVQADFQPPHVAVKHVAADHPLADVAFDCPVCDESLSGRCVALVPVGIEPGDRKPAGWTTGGAVAVHATCAGVDASACSCVADRGVTFDVR